MVRRLVEAQQGGRPHQHAGQGQARLLTAREHRHLLVHAVTREEEGAEDRAQPRVRRLGRDRLHLFQHRARRIQRVELVLGVIMDGHVRAQRALAAIEGQHAGQHLEQRGLAGAVVADQRHPLAALHREVDAAIDHVVAVGLVDAGQRGHATARAWGLREREVHLPAHPGQLDALDLGQHLHPALHLAGLGGLIAKALDEALDLGDALGLVARARLQQLAPGLALDEEVVVVAGVDREALGREVGDRGHHAVDEVAIVRDHHHGAVVGGQEVLEPRQRGEVEVVGGLVEQQQRGRHQQQPGQRRAHAPAPGELFQRPVELVGGEPEAAEDGAGRRLQPVAAERLEAVLQLAVALGEGLAGRRLQRPGHVLHLALERPHLLEPAERLDQHGAGDGAAGHLLRQVADRRRARAAHLPAVGLLQPGQDATERGLAGAVGTDETDALAVGDAPADVAEENLTPVPLGDAVELDHRRPITPCSGSSRA